MMTIEQFYGAWRLVDYAFETDGDGEPRPFGTEADGLIIYDRSGAMSMQMMGRDRLHFAGNDPMKATPEEIKSAYAGMNTYFGSFSVDDDAQTVTHHIIAASLPNRAGTDLLRHYEFQEGGKRLILRTTPRMLGGKTLSGWVLWERVT